MSNQQLNIVNATIRLSDRGLTVEGIDFNRLKKTIRELERQGAKDVRVFRNERGEYYITYSKPRQSQQQEQQQEPVNIANARIKLNDKGFTVEGIDVNRLKQTVQQLEEQGASDVRLEKKDGEWHVSYKMPSHSAIKYQPSPIAEKLARERLAATMWRELMLEHAGSRDAGAGIVRTVKLSTPVKSVVDIPVSESFYKTTTFNPKPPDFSTPDVKLLRKAVEKDSFWYGVAAGATATAIATINPFYAVKSAVEFGKALKEDWKGALSFYATKPGLGFLVGQALIPAGFWAVSKMPKPKRLVITRELEIEGGMRLPPRGPSVVEDAGGAGSTASTLFEHIVRRVQFPAGRSAGKMVFEPRYEEVVLPSKKASSTVLLLERQPLRQALRVQESLWYLAPGRARLVPTVPALLSKESVLQRQRQLAQQLQLQQERQESRFAVSPLQLSRQRQLLRKRGLLEMLEQRQSLASAGALLQLQGQKAKQAVVAIATVSSRQKSRLTLGLTQQLGIGLGARQSLRQGLAQKQGLVLKQVQAQQQQLKQAAQQVLQLRTVQVQTNKLQLKQQVKVTPKVRLPRLGLIPQKRKERRKEARLFRGMRINPFRLDILSFSSTRSKRGRK